MQRLLPKTRDIVLVGGGHTHALVLRRWGMRGLPGARLTLINPGATTSYSGMLPGFVAGHYTRDELEIDLVRLARFAGARLIHSRVEGIDLEAGTVELDNRTPVSFDVLSLDIGVHGELSDFTGFRTNGVAAKPLDAFAGRWAAFRNELKPGSHASAVVIGAGVAGVELALAMRHGAARRSAELSVTVVDRSAAMSGLRPATKKLIQNGLAASGVEMLESSEVATIEASAVRLTNGQCLDSDFTVGAGGPQPYGWLSETGLALEAGYLKVNARLQSLTDPRVFAAGDCAHLTHAPRPKAGVYAVRAAPTLYANLFAALDAGPWQTYRPQRDYLKLISMGDKVAVADKGLSLKGRWLWRLKDSIDRRFMDKLNNLEPMKPPKAPALAAPGVAEKLQGPVLCGGCGAKVGRNTLDPALSQLNGSRIDIETGPGDDAAVIRVGDDRLVITTDHLRAFTEDPYVMSRVASIHALGDIFAMGATPQAVLPSLTLPPLSEGLQARTLDEIMAAARDVFSQAGAQIVGGHTATGAELSVGFTVTGKLSRKPITLHGAKPNDKLILTKPLGTGVIMAAEMALAADGRDVAEALALMQKGSAEAARILADANAMTDVTGFGLAGHLLGILDASGLGAELYLQELPLLRGAEKLVRSGHRSSLFAENLASSGPRVAAPQYPRVKLLYDPQTAGGLVASVPPEAADDLVEELTAAGYSGGVIGTVRAGTSRIVVH
ncbi:MAG: selenide, water dikinase SelD [Anderseniella sp.]